MPPRQKKFVGMIILLGGFFAYIIAAINVADWLPANKFIEIAYFAVAGIAWIFPVKHLMIWMNRDPKIEPQIKEHETLES